MFLEAKNVSVKHGVASHSPTGASSMSLYQLQKFLYDLNRDARVQAHYRDDLNGLLSRYELTDEERNAISRGDVGLSLRAGRQRPAPCTTPLSWGLPWPDYIQAMRNGVATHGPVRLGIYAMKTRMDEKVWPGYESGVCG